MHLWAGPDSRQPDPIFGHFAPTAGWMGGMAAWKLVAGGMAAGDGWVAWWLVAWHGSGETE